MSKPAIKASSAAAETTSAEIGEGHEEGRRQRGRREGGEDAQGFAEAAVRQGRPALGRQSRQIAKGYGDAPVQAYIAAMPGWKSEVGRRLDALIERAVPAVRKAVKCELALLRNRRTTSGSSPSTASRNTSR